MAIRRRQFISAFGGTVLVWPLAARAQQPTLPVIGVLHSASTDPRSAYWSAMAAFRRGVGDSGFLEGQNVSYEFRWAEDQFARLPTLAADLVRRNVSLIFAGGGDVAVLAAKNATATIPIVFAIGADPVAQGIVASLGRPGANITGVTFLFVELRPKMLDLIRDLLPKVSTIAILGNPNRPNYQALLDQMQASAQTRGLQVRILTAGSGPEIDSAFNILTREPVDALLVLSDPVYLSQCDQLARLELQYRVPTVNASREFVVAGSLASYGANIEDSYYQAGIYAGRILKGDKPSELPVQQPTKFELVLNLKTAKALGLSVPQSILARADEVIE
jgi:putative ABC transport system substrate-binding protein